MNQLQKVLNNQEKVQILAKSAISNSYLPQTRHDPNIQDSIMLSALIGISEGSEKYDEMLEDVDYQSIQRVKRGTDKVKDAVKKLKNQGFKEARTKGSHTIFVHDDGRSMSIPNAKSKPNEKLSPGVHNQVENVLNGHGRGDLNSAGCRSKRSVGNPCISSNVDENINNAKKNIKKILAAAAGTSVANMAVEGGHLAMIRNGLGEIAIAHETVAQEYTSTHLEDVGGLRAIGADAGVTAIHAGAFAEATPLKARAAAVANAAEAKANAILLEGVLEANARAVAAEASATAEVSVTGVNAQIGARVGRVEVGISNTPLQAHAEGPGAIAEAGASLEYSGAAAGFHAGEARAGPFAARAGLKFGAGIRNGVPEVDLGPVTVPCCIM